MKGTFITFEGIEGSGKSTQIVLLANYLMAHKKQVTLTREPGGTAIGDQVRKVLLDPANSLLVPSAELLLYAAARAQHLEELIRPELEAGKIVLCDRFSDATLAYQGYGRGLDRGMISDLDRMVTGGIRPDLTVLLDIDAEAGVSRARGGTTAAGSKPKPGSRTRNWHSMTACGRAILPWRPGSPAASVLSTPPRPPRSFRTGCGRSSRNCCTAGFNASCLFAG